MKKICLFIFGLITIVLSSCTTEFAITLNKADFKPYIEKDFYFSEKTYLPIDFYEIGWVSIKAQNGIIKSKKNKVKVDKEEVQNRYCLTSQTSKIDRNAEPYYMTTLNTFLNEAYLEAKEMGGDGIINFKFIVLQNGITEFVGTVVKKK